MYSAIDIIDTKYQIPFDKHAGRGYRQCHGLYGVCIYSDIYAMCDTYLSQMPPIGCSQFLSWPYTRSADSCFSQPPIHLHALLECACVLGKVE